MQQLPKTKLIPSWNPKRRRRAFIVLELAKRRRKRAADDVEEELSVPPAPVGLSININVSDFFLVWVVTSESEDGCRLYRSAFGDPFELVAEISADSETNDYEFYDAAVEMGVSYTYFVVAYNAAGESEPSNAVEGELTGA